MRGRLIDVQRPHGNGYVGYDGYLEVDMSKHVTIAEARDQLSAHIRSAEHGTAVVITRRGRPVAAIVAAEDFARLERLRAAGPQSGLAGLAGGWEDSEELVRALDAHRRSPLRPTADLE
jgi:prevent-host-death family protein